MDHSNNCGYSPIDYGALRESLNFTGLTPERALPQIGFHGDVAETSTSSTALTGSIDQPLSETHSPDYAQRTQVLFLPPCSPARQITFLAEMEPKSLQLRKFPSPLPETGAEHTYTLPPEPGTEVGNSHPTFAQVRDFVGTSVLPLSTGLQSLHKSVHEHGLTINGLQDVAIANQGMLFEKFQEVWTALTSASAELAAGHQETSCDLATFRTKFNDLVQTYLPEQVSLLHHNLHSLFSEADKKFQEICPKLEQNILNCNEVFGHVQQLAHDFASFSSQVSVSTKNVVPPEFLAQFAQLQIELAQLRENYQMHLLEFGKLQQLAVFPKCIEEDFPSGLQIFSY